MDMKRLNILQYALTLLLLLTVPFSLAPLQISHAETLTSPNYRIDGAVIGGGMGDITDSGTGNYSLFATISDFSGNPRSNSNLYQLRPGNPEIFLANTTKVSCFETTSSGSSNCSTGPSYLNNHGMVRVCGALGCYNRARFEIDIQQNPSDTLYSIQISSDNFASDIQVIDGVSNRPKDISSKQLSDYLSKVQWETPVFNILGLQSDTQYWIRVTALHGDFTESEPGPIATASTAPALVSFDIDITDQAESTPETASPYTISFTGSNQLVAGGAQVTATNLIWLDLDTNGVGGAAIVKKGIYGGLYSTGGSYTITSANADLATAPEGFGLQNYDYSGTGTYQEDYSGSGGSDLGSISVEAPYNSGGYNVGIVGSTFSKIYDGLGPIDQGRVAAFVRARASGAAPGQSDYTETVTFVVVGRY